MGLPYWNFHTGTLCDSDTHEPCSVDVASTSAPTGLGGLGSGLSSSSPLTQYSRYSTQLRAGRVAITSLLNTSDGKGGRSYDGVEIVVGGWVKTGREQGKGSFAFLELNDGSCATNLQCLLDKPIAEAAGKQLSEAAKTGACVVLRGYVVALPEQAKQSVEVKTTELLHLGPCDASKYPIAKAKLGLEFLRGVSHLRPRTNVIAAVSRIRSACSFATHDFFARENGMLYVHTPLITSSDCEGAGEMFAVTTLLKQMEDMSPSSGEGDAKAAADAAAHVQSLRDAASKQGEAVRDLKAKVKSGGASPEEVKAAVDKLLATKKELEGAEAATKSSVCPVVPGNVDYSQDFFAKPAFLTVSGQLQAEIYACALGSVYTFGPTFRAENSNTSRHLAEFWMVEPEVAFADLDDDMRLAEAYVKHCLRHVMETCADDMVFLTNFVDKTCIDRVNNCLNEPFGRCSYTEAVDILKEHAGGGKVTFDDMDIHWGMDLGSEHERYLCEKVFNKPVIVYNYPKEMKAFYMRLNDDDKTVAAMDVLVPGVGELIGGSQREERIEVLDRRLEELKLDPEMYRWYLDLRRYGTVTHSGFGLGLERLILFITGLENIRDVIPFPRWPSHCDK